MWLCVCGSVRARERACENVCVITSVCERAGLRGGVVVVLVGAWVGAWMRRGLRVGMCGLGCMWMRLGACTCCRDCAGGKRHAHTRENTMEVQQKMLLGLYRQTFYQNLPLRHRICSPSKFWEFASWVFQNLPPEQILVENLPV